MLNSVKSFLIVSQQNATNIEDNMSCNQNMLSLIEVLNRVQDTLVSLGFKGEELVKRLPQIAVVGSQSAGKSSVLESIVGRDFLPRGKDVVTRRPLILQLKQNRKNSETFGKFSHSDDIYTDFNKIREEIEAETNRTVPDYAISSDPINLKITSPDVLDLNLIDLPGITKVAVGKQPEDIESIVKKLVMGFISKENCLILAVTPANQDLSTSDAIKLSREVDPEGKRTIGVLTKLDLMDKGTDARNILLNLHKIKLNKGFIGVINRSTKDIEINKSLNKAMADEKKFFEKHPAYKTILDRVGIENLQICLQKELALHLNVGIPSLRQKFESELFEVEESIEKLNLTVNELTPNELISQTSDKFKQNFRNEIGTGDDVPVDRECKGANINVIMTVKYAQMLSHIVHDIDAIKRNIRLSIKNLFGTRCEPFVPNKAFTNVVRKQIDLMFIPSLNCVDSVYEELESIVRQSAEEIGNYPKIIEMYTTTTLEFLKECKKNCRERIKHSLDAEKSYLNATNEDFIKSIKNKKTGAKNSLLLYNSLMINEKSGWINSNDYYYFFSIENRTLYWSNTTQNKYENSLDLSGVKVTVVDDTLILTRNQMEIKLKFETKEDMMDWNNSILHNSIDETLFKPKISNQVLADSSQNISKILNNIKDNKITEQNGEYPIPIEAQVEEVKQLVLAYIKNVEKTMRDTLPKNCQMELIDATEHFVADTLRNKIQNKELEIDDLIDRDPMEEKLNDLINQKEVYEETLKAMNEMLKQR